MWSVILFSFQLCWSSKPFLSQSHVKGSSHLVDVIVELPCQHLVLLTFSCFVQPGDTERVHREKTSLQLLHFKALTALTEDNQIWLKLEFYLKGGFLCLCVYTLWLAAVQMSVFSVDAVFSRLWICCCFSLCWFISASPHPHKLVGKVKGLSRSDWRSASNWETQKNT